MRNNDGTLDDKYFYYLYSLIGVVRNRNPARSHWELAKQLYSTEFVWSVPNDDNRIADGRDLREEFFADLDPAERDQTWLDMGCSMLEMLIALSRRVAFQTNGDPFEWFWIMLRNLDIDVYSDAVFDSSAERMIERILGVFINRTYKRDGTGGLFPLDHPRQDQRKVEIAYQMSTYLLERTVL